MDANDPGNIPVSPNSCKKCGSQEKLTGYQLNGNPHYLCGECVWGGWTSHVQQVRSLQDINPYFNVTDILIDGEAQCPEPSSLT